MGPPITDHETRICANRTAQVHDGEASLCQLVTERGRLEHAENLAMLGEACAAVVHEINNPLTAIVAQSQLLRLALDQRSELGDAVFDKIQQRLVAIENATHSMGKLVRSLSNLTRQSSPEKRPYSVDVVLNRSLELLEPLMALANVKTTLHVEGVELMSEGDQDMIAQVFVNILANAKDALESVQRPEGRRIAVVAKALSDLEIQVSFNDNGIGMSAQTLAKVFSPFFTTKERGKGTGLGMSISQGIIKDHKGRISYASGIGRGTDVTIVLPRLDPRQT